MLKLRMTVLAGALAFASLPAVAVDLPDYGSKNFSPADDTPAYLANESVPVAARTADTTERDWSDVDAMAPARSSFGYAHSAHRIAHRHGHYSYAHFSGGHAVARSGGARNAARTTSAKHSRARHASGLATHPGA